MLRLVKFVLVSASLVLSEINAARILGVFPTPSISHQVVFRPLVQELARRGHEVIIITTDPAFPKGKSPENLTEIDVHDASYNMWREKFLKTSTGNNDDIFTQIKVGLELIGEIFAYQMELKEVQDTLKNNQFDLLMLEALVEPALALSHVIKTPVIQVSSFGGFFFNYQTMGTPVHPVLYPTIFRQKLVNLTLHEKLSELYNHYYVLYLFDSVLDSGNRMVRRIFGDELPCLSELRKNVDMLFLNVHPIWDSNRPVPPGVIFMGGLHQNPVKELPKYWLDSRMSFENTTLAYRSVRQKQVCRGTRLLNSPSDKVYTTKELKSYLDSSKNGIIYISFGTNVNPSQLPAQKIQILVKVFSRLPYDILWKWDKDELPGKPKNIRISKWLPQSDLLRHPKIKLFITQGGLQSTDEAITAGVPLLGMPMLGDQWYNVEQYKLHGIGVRVDMEKLTEEHFENAVNSVILDESYRRNIVRLRTMMRDQPQSPLERAVWWTEFVIRHKGAKHLRSPAANMSWSEYLELELAFMLLALGTILAVVCSVIVYFVSRSISKHFFGDVKVKNS